MKEYILLEQKYKLIKNEKEGFDYEKLKEIFTDYFLVYDYVVGDWAYGKIRLKGFNKKDNKQYKKINDFSNVDSYLKDYCAFGCRHFIIEKIKD